MTSFVVPGSVIQVRYTEDVAQAADFRPVRRQAMTLRELVGLALASIGKRPERVRALLAAGTCTYNIYRYWWEGFAVGEAELAALLAEFPDPDPARAFDPRAGRWALLSDASEPKPRTAQIEQADAGRRWFRRQSFWDFLLDFAVARSPRYFDYSYYHRGDLYCLALTAEDDGALREAAARLAPRAARQRLAAAAPWVRLELFCPRS